MTRQMAPALGLLALALTFAPPPPATADEPAAQGGHAAAPAATAAHGAPAVHAAGKHDDAGLSGTAAAASGHGGEAGHPGQPNILEPQAPLAIWTVVVFGTLLLILGRFAWKPMMKAMHDREEHVEHCLLEAERARNEAEKLMAENQKNLARAADQVRAMLDEARKGAEATAASIVQKAQAEAEASLERARREIGTARDQALTEIFSQAADLAVGVAGKVLGRDLSESDHRRLIETAMSELPAMPNGRGVRS